MIIYVAVFSMIFTMILGLFDRVQVVGNKTRIASDLRENGTYIMKILGHAVREADSIDLSNSAFNVDPSIISLIGDDAVTMDTHMQSVVVGGVPVTIRKIKMRYGTGPGVNISSDHINVTRFIIRDITQAGSPSAIQVELGLSSISPSGNSDYEDTFFVRDSFSLRKEL